MKKALTRISRPQMIAAILMVLGLGMNAHAAVIYSRNFEGNQTPAGGWDIRDRNSTAHTFNEVIDTSDLFGQGTSNHYAAYDKVGNGEGNLQVASQSAAGSGNALLGAGPGTWAAPASGIMTVAFDMYEPSTGGGDNVSFRVGNGTSIQSSGTTDRFSIGIDDGVIAGNNIGAQDMLVRFELITNATGAALTDYFGTNDIANNRADLWIYDYATGTRSLIGDDINTDDGNIVSNWSAGTTMTMGFYAFSGNSGQELLIDNVLVHDEAFLPVAMPAVPEPMTGLLAALGAMAMIGHRRRAAA